MRIAALTLRRVPPSSWSLEMLRSRIVGRIAFIASALAPLAPALSQTMTITATEPMTTDNPYGDSSSPVYSLWCHTYGCLGRIDVAAQKPIGILAEKWEAIDPLTWRFTLRRDLKRHDGGPGPTSADVIHSINRIRTDPQSAQGSNIATIDSVVAIDDHTFDIKTKAPAVNLIASIFDRVIVTSAELYAKLGRDADRKAPFGWGPYKLKEYSADRRVVIHKNADWREPDGADTSAPPEVVVFQQMREPEQRVNALLNNEVQVARSIPPQLAPRLQDRSDVKLLKTGGVEVMFLAFNNTMPPWTDVRVRRAAALAVNRPLIVDRLLDGYAQVQDGLVGPNQLCYSGPPERVNSYDPKRAKALLAEAGYPNGGPDIVFNTAVGRYVSDRQVAEVVAQMLRQVGFRVTLNAPEYANFWAAVRKGAAPFFYMGRGSVFDPSDAAGQFLGTGQSPRVQYSNPEFDRLLAAQFAEPDPKKRCDIWRQLNQIVIDEAPMHFMWTHSVLTGERANIDLKIDVTGEFWLPDAVVK